MFRNRFRDFVKSLMLPSQSERKRILLLLPLLVIICLLFRWQARPRFEKSFTLYTDTTIENTGQSGSYSSPEKEKAQPEAEPQTKSTYFTFDPNTIDKNGLIRLGFTDKQATVILNYRKAGAVFRKPEDFLRCYSVSEEKFNELKPHIKIGRQENCTGTQAHDKTWTVNTPESSDISTTTNIQRVAPPASGLLELNTADSAALIRIRGIGALTAGRIVRYREALGGFAHAAQLLEVKGMNSENFEKIIPQIYVDSSRIKKIDINFATPQRFMGHPYLPPRMTDKILKHRQLKGGWSSTGELIEAHILTEQQAERLAPYFYFRAE